MKNIAREVVAVSRIAVLIGIVIVAAVVASIAYLYWLRGPEATAVIGPEGGVVEVTDFKSPLYGLTLDIPAGALQENITISVKELPKSRVDSILSARKFASTSKHMLGGFVAEPDGLVFNVPINVSLPVDPLNTSGGIPVQAKVLLDEDVYWLEPTDLVFRPEDGMVDMTVQDFSEHAVVELEELLKKNPGNEDCRKGRIKVESAMEDFSRGSGCQIVTDIVKVTFLDCKPPVTEHASLYEVTPECGPESTLTIEVDPPSATLFPCTTKTLKAHVKYNGEEVEDMDITWFNDPNQDVAEVDQKGVVTGLHEGETKILAVSPFPQFYGECTIKVVGSVCSLEVTPSQATVFIGTPLPLTAIPKDVDGEKVEGLIPNWESNDKSVATVDSSGMVTGVSPGTAKITATVEDVGKNLWADADITVKEPGSVVIFPEEATIYVDQTLHLTVMVYDKDGNELKGYSVEWTIPPSDVIAFDAVTQTVRGVSLGTAKITATGEGASASAKITVVRARAWYRLTWKSTISENFHLSGGDELDWHDVRYSYNAVFEGHTEIEEVYHNNSSTFQTGDFWTQGHYNMSMKYSGCTIDNTVCIFESGYIVYDITDIGAQYIKDHIELSFNVGTRQDGSIEYIDVSLDDLFFEFTAGKESWIEATVFTTWNSSEIGLGNRSDVGYFPHMGCPDPHLEYDETTKSFFKELDVFIFYAGDPIENPWPVYAHWEIKVEVIHEEAGYSSLQSNNNQTSINALTGDMGSARKLSQVFITTMILIATNICLATRKPKVKPPAPSVSLFQLDYELL